MTRPAGSGRVPNLHRNYDSRPAVVTTRHRPPPIPHTRPGSLQYHHTPPQGGQHPYVPYDPRRAGPGSQSNGRWSPRPQSSVGYGTQQQTYSDYGSQRSDHRAEGSSYGGRSPPRRQAYSPPRMRAHSPPRRQAHSPPRRQMHRPSRSPSPASSPGEESSGPTIIEARPRWERNRRPNRSPSVSSVYSNDYGTPVVSVNSDIYGNSDVYSNSGSSDLFPGTNGPLREANSDPNGVYHENRPMRPQQNRAPSSRHSYASYSERGYEYGP